MSPECLYWVALLVLVVPSAPFNKSALVVLAVWAFGHIIYRIGPFDDASCMFARIVAIGAALAVSHPWDGSRRALAQGTVALLFVPAALLSAYAAIYFNHPPADMAEYHEQTNVYWLTYAIIMLQAIAVPVGNDWQRIGKVVNKFDNWAINQIVKRFGDAL